MSRALTMPCSQQLGILGLEQLGSPSHAGRSRAAAPQHGLLDAVLMGLAGILSEPVRYRPAGRHGSGHSCA